MNSFLLNKLCKHFTTHFQQTTFWNPKFLRKIKIFTKLQKKENEQKKVYQCTAHHVLSTIKCTHWKYIGSVSTRNSIQIKPRNTQEKYSQHSSNTLYTSYERALTFRFFMLVEGLKKLNNIIRYVYLITPGP